MCMPGIALPVIGFSNNGSLRTPRLDMNGDGKVTVREVDSLMALQFKAAHETLTGRDVKRVLAEQFRRDDGRLGAALARHLLERDVSVCRMRYGW